MRIVYPWLCDLVRVSADPDSVAREMALRGFEVAAVEPGPLPVIDFEITANRPDCLSHVGLAREAAAIWRLPLQMPDMTSAPAGPPEPFEVILEDSNQCPRYCAQVFEVRVAQSPTWIAERLEAAGIRPINNVVDVSNYVMLELGHPTHAFDLVRLSDRTLVIRRARAGETLRTLDNVGRALVPDMLVIADAARATAIGGVMGGRDSEIGPATTRIVLESAYFDPVSVRRASKHLGLQTEASIRFERGADINAPPMAIARAAALFRKINAGRPLGAAIDRYPSPRTPSRIRLRAARITRILGHNVPQPEVPRILEPLGFEVATSDNREGPGWTITVPSFRVDVAREIDLIEEVGRHHGFDRLPATFPPLVAPQAAPDPAIGRDRLMGRILTAAGFSEAVTFAFIERRAALPFCDADVEPAAIKNPLSEKFAVLRPSLLPGLIDACAHNRRRDRRDVRLFETGSRFTASGEGRAAAFVWCGGATDPHWSSPARPVDFFDAKGLVEQMCSTFGVAADFVACDCRFLTRGRAAAACARGNGSSVTLGVVGQLLPAVVEGRGFPAAEEIFAGEIDLRLLSEIALREDVRAQPLPRFPSIVRDISVLVDEALPAAAVRGTIRSAAPETLVSMTEFDRYLGTGVPPGRISLSLRLTFRAPDRTLTDEEVQASTERIIEALRSNHGAEQR